MTKKEQIQNQPPLVYRASHLTLDKIMNTQNSRHVKLFQSKVKMYVSKITPNISELLFSLWYPLLTHYRVNIPGKAGVFPSHTRKSVPGWCRQADNINKLHCCQPALWLEVLTRLTSSAPLRAGLSPPESLAFFLTYEDPTHTHTHTHTAASRLQSLPYWHPVNSLHAARACSDTSDRCHHSEWWRRERPACSAGSWHLCLNVAFSFLHVKDRLSHKCYILFFFFSNRQIKQRVSLIGWWGWRQCDTD